MKLNNDLRKQQDERRTDHLTRKMITGLCVACTGVMAVWVMYWLSRAFG